MSAITEVSIKNFRCFGAKQVARLAPLTFLVGENNTGKTSFLAMIRALWDAASICRNPDFQEEPFDLGSFEDIGHRVDPHAEPAASIAAGFRNQDGFFAQIVLARGNGLPQVQKRRVGFEGAILEATVPSSDVDVLDLMFKTQHGAWTCSLNRRDFPTSGALSEQYSKWPAFDPHYLRHLMRSSGRKRFAPLGGFSEPTGADRSALSRLISASGSFTPETVFAPSPFRTKPRRSFSPTSLIPDSAGDSVAVNLTAIEARRPSGGAQQKGSLQAFGRQARLFDDISIEQLGDMGAGPLQVRVAVGNLDQNLIDVGYGVSQVLPVIAEHCRPSSSRLYLLQQPEIHLHPRAQAALGSFFCEVVRKNSQLVIETHSDYIIDRVRMDVRDRKSALSAENVSILYFDRSGSEVRVHSIRLDDVGNIVGAPPAYRRFFLDELDRSIGP